MTKNLSKNNLYLTFNYLWLLYFKGKLKFLFITKVIIKTYKPINKESSMAVQLSGQSANFTSRDCVIAWEDLEQLL